MVRLSPLALPALVVLCASRSPVIAFTPGVPALAPRNVALNAPSKMSRLYNVPPPSADDPAAVKESADKQTPPASFYQLQIDSARAALLAMDDGYRLIEVEFPPLPANVLEMDDVSAYDVAKANLNLAIDFAKSFAQNNKRVTIMLPDEDELGIALEDQGTDTPYPGVTVSSLRRSEGEEKERVFKPDQLFLNLFGTGSSGSVKAMEGTDVYVCIVASAQELPDIEELSELEPNKTIVFYNLKLDVLRGDLGAPAFPGKDFQDRFLSQVKPVYYLRTRQYSRSTARPPFMVNYQGCLFRSYPGQYQTLLDTGNGRYRRVLGNVVRPALGEFKEQLTDALREQGIIEEEGKTLNFLRTGYKTTTWWEEEREDASDSWKT
uniref:DUF1995 domain-containing protein n=1 Tax=Odontella aurita TaxID=265563 RepID=A0A7S4IJG4_9STRA|mmetsp:Transcript_25841/g.76377  ORF Transcript_25841/g.76377 Transcript_25841/m.76377 type:complete len:378 (+) Transcript_25841:229-1362(+)|eukprot:CAMPEP_0113559024 /NCGR_PEP_ID=MMETSP0015_2-20120614/18671_1 /TAXON_ID=2838 /ORGANISM="Odontella" /LENGTH=377 /DNA_ID=CAMNT_0000460623 /DNA_START=205 /DNA_END=1338 /DNA_ORIENTATION=+ /assembly_acc=CAM_ASM_000160